MHATVERETPARWATAGWLIFASMRAPVSAFSETPERSMLDDVERAPSVTGERDCTRTLERIGLAMRLFHRA